VQIDDAIERVEIVLQRDPLTQGAEVVAEVEGIGRRLNAGEHTRARALAGH